MPSKNYYWLHLRSLFISKFNYSSRGQVLRLRAFSILLGGPFSSFSVMFLLFFLVFGVLPSIRYIDLRLFGGGKRSLAFCFYTFTGDRALAFLNIFFVTYFFFLESSEDLQRLFSCTVRQLTPLMIMRKSFYIFFELDFLFNYAFTFLKLFTSTWVMRFNFGLGASSPLERQALLRSFSLFF